MNTEAIVPLDDSFTKDFLVLDRFQYYRDQLNKQLAKRPEVWGRGFWPDEESEEIAKKVAEFIAECGETEQKAFVPQDKLRIIDLFDYEWGAIREVLESTNEEFDCDIDMEELLPHEEMTLGEFVALVKARKGSGKKAAVSAVSAKDTTSDSLSTSVGEFIMDWLGPFAWAFVMLAVAIIVSIVSHAFGIAHFKAVAMAVSVLCFFVIVIAKVGWRELEKTLVFILFNTAVTWFVLKGFPFDRIWALFE